MNDYSIPGRRHGGGFSLIELVITLVVAAVLAAVAMPSLSGFMRRNEVTSEANDLLADLQYARSEALTQRSFVSVCPRAPTAGAGDESCADGDSANFDGGWLIYGATTAHAVYDSADAAHPLLRLTAVPDTLSMRAGAAGVVTFNSRGELVGNAGDVVIAVCYKEQRGSAEAGTSTATVPGKQVQVSTSGRAAAMGLAAGQSCG